MKTRETYVSGSVFQFTDSYIIINYSHDGFPIPKNPNIEINFYSSQFFIRAIGLLTLLWFYYLHLCSYMRYVTFNTNFNICSKKNNIITPMHLDIFIIYYATVAPGVWVWPNPTVYCPSVVIQIMVVVDLALKFSKSISWAIFGTLSIYIFSIAVTPVSCMLCLIVFHIGCHCAKHVPHWLPIILIILSNDVHTNPGSQFKNNFFNLMTWNVNPLAKENFQRVHLIEAHNSIFNYDLISICETSLNDSVELPETLLDDYTFVLANNPSNTRHGGVGLFYRNTLPIMVEMICPLMRR